jgi:Uma2 family endonuclease
MVDPMLDPEFASENMRPISRREYDKLVELGAFEAERVELLRGVLVTMTPQGGAHANVSAWFAQRLTRLLDESFDVRSHSPYPASDDSEPEPDVSVNRPPRSLLEHPDRTLLVIEVSDSSLRKDRRIKLPIYAQAGVPEYWIASLKTGNVEVYTQPGPDGYQRLETYDSTGTLRPTSLPGIAIAVAEIPFPPPE